MIYKKSVPTDLDNEIVSATARCSLIHTHFLLSLTSFNDFLIFIGREKTFKSETQQRHQGLDAKEAFYLTLCTVVRPILKEENLQRQPVIMACHNENLPRGWQLVSPMLFSEFTFVLPASFVMQVLTENVFLGGINSFKCLSTDEML